MRLYFTFANLYLKIRCVFCFTRRNFKSNDEVKSNNPLFEYNFFCPLNVERRMLQELPAAIDFASTLPKKCSVTNREVDRMMLHEFPDAIDTLKSRKNGGLYKEITKWLLSSNGNIEYYLSICQSTVYGSHHICLIRRKLNVQRVMNTIFELTLPGARALLSVCQQRCWPPTLIKNCVRQKNLQQFHSNARLRTWYDVYLNIKFIKIPHYVTCF